MQPSLPMKAFILINNAHTNSMFYTQAPSTLVYIYKYDVVLLYIWVLCHMWMIRCCLSHCNVIYANPHISHWYGFSPVWVNMWSFRCLDWVNALPHVLHLCGFSQVCVLICRLRICILVWENIFCKYHIYMVSHLCEFLYVPSDCQTDWMSSHMFHIYMVSHLYGPLYASSDTGTVI